MGMESPERLVEPARDRDRRQPKSQSVGGMTRATAPERKSATVPATIMPATPPPAPSGSHVGVRDDCLMPEHPNQRLNHFNRRLNVGTDRWFLRLMQLRRWREKKAIYD
jgi:hypothetical protein